ncbi:hypothetical protein PsorP6_003986 [Peronosclerospora sorghi]|uniref:Uncharacterized protein n=1 Tax=Peronosclerospora sorghi TaxID=230839 RepID=A0ACC0VJZ2_9STRA|nr:hypothetical protein PsorP6_003986 [Peronosclerospora sorghi]
MSSSRDHQADEAAADNTAKSTACSAGAATTRSVRPPEAAAATATNAAEFYLGQQATASCWRQYSSIKRPGAENHHAHEHTQFLVELLASRPEVMPRAALEVFKSVSSEVSDQQVKNKASALKSALKKNPSGHNT